MSSLAQIISRYLITFKPLIKLILASLGRNNDSVCEIINLFAINPEALTKSI